MVRIIWTWDSRKNTTKTSQATYKGQKLEDQREHELKDCICYSYSSSCPCVELHKIVRIIWIWGSRYNTRKNVASNLPWANPLTPTRGAPVGGATTLPGIHSQIRIKGGKALHWAFGTWPARPACWRAPHGISGCPENVKIASGAVIHSPAAQTLQPPAGTSGQSSCAAATPRTQSKRATRNIMVVSWWLLTCVNFGCWSAHVALLSYWRVKGDIRTIMIIIKHRSNCTWSYSTTNRHTSRHAIFEQ